jgi:hypothetical protein
MNKCTTCLHRGFRDMMRQPYGYAGPIPCSTCRHFSYEEDNYVGTDATIRIEFDEHGPCFIETTVEAADAAGVTE